MKQENSDEVEILKIPRKKWNKGKVNLVVGEGKLIEKDVLCNGRTVKAPIDTGAFVSVVNKRVVDNHKWEIDNKKLPGLIGADGNSLNTCGITKLQIRIQLGQYAKVKYYDVAVVRNLTAELLIGLELMKAFKICIDTAEGRLYFKKESNEV